MRRHDAAPLAKLVRDMARTFATGLPPLRDFGGSLSRYRYLVARAQLADLARRVTLGSRPREPLRHRLLRLPSAGDTAAPLQHRAKGIILKDLTEGDPGRLLAPFTCPSGRETVGLTAFPAAPPGLVLRCCCCSGRCCKLWLTCVLCRDHRSSAMIGA